MKKTIILMLLALTSIIAAAQVAPWPVRDSTYVKLSEKQIRLATIGNCSIETESFDTEKLCQQECAKAVARMYQTYNKPFDNNVNAKHCIENTRFKNWKCSLSTIVDCSNVHGDAHKGKSMGTPIDVVKKVDSDTLIKPSMTTVPADNTRVSLPQTPASQKTN